MRKILVLRGGALGDFIVTLPALAALREHWPAAHIELAGNATAAQLALNRGLLDAVHSQHEARWSGLFSADPLPTDFRAWLSEFDLVLTFWPDPDDAIGRRFPLRVGQLFLAAAALPEHSPAAAHYYAPLRTLGIEARGNFCRIETGRVILAPPRLQRTSAIESLPSVKSKDTPLPILIHPGSGSAQKNWPGKNWIELIPRLPSPIALVLGEAEWNAWNPIVDSLTDTLVPRANAHRPIRTRALINLPLEDLVIEFSRCRLFIGHDSGISHLAAACGAKCMLLFGPTEPAMWAPPAPNVQVLRQGSDLNRLPVEDVQRAVVAALEDQR